MKKRAKIIAPMLPATVFLTGACVLIIEITATRILSPFFGNTMFTVSSVISVVLAGLSIGYHYGGKLADKYPKIELFYAIIAFSGAVALFFYYIGNTLLPTISDNVSISTGSLISSILVFFVPSTLLGTASPFAVRLSKDFSPDTGVGSVSGNIFFWSTLGSIAGSLSAGFILIPRAGVNTLMVSVCTALFLLGLVPLFFLHGLKLKHIAINASIFCFIGLIAFGSGEALQNSQGDLVHQEDGLYEKIAIHDEVENNRPVRRFTQDKSKSGAMYLDTDDPTDLVYDYTKYYELYKVFDVLPKNAYVIGGGAYSIPKALLYELPDVHVDVTEIEPSLYRLSKEYFNLQDSPRLENHIIDGRQFLRRSDKKYDYIFSDVYYSYYSVPSHFTTREFFVTAKNGLAENGIFIASMVGNLKRNNPSLIMSELKTFKSVFPNSYFFATKSPSSLKTQNIILVGINGNKDADFITPSQDLIKNSPLKELESKQIDLKRFEFKPYSMITDDYAPVDFLTAKILNQESGEHFISGDEMMSIIRQQLRYGPRNLSAAGHEKVQDFIQSELQALHGAEVVTQEFTVSQENQENLGLKNIIARVNPEIPKRILLGTHYDTKKHADNDDPSRPVPGANDGASGTAVLLELARTVHGLELFDNIGVDFVFFDGEEGTEDIISDYSEWSPLGSNYFADNLDELYDSPPEEAVIVDMVCSKDLSIWKEPQSTKQAKTQTDKLWRIGKENFPEIFIDKKRNVVYDDHTPLIKAGIPAQLLIDKNYEYFHTTSDTADKCSAESLAAVASTLANYLTHE